MKTPRCWLCQRFPEDQKRCRDLSFPKLQKHHWIPQQTLRREFPRGHEGRNLRSLLTDPRNLTHLRSWHHYQYENARVRIPRAMVPREVNEFAAELGLSWWLDRTFGPARAAA